MNHHRNTSLKQTIMSGSQFYTAQLEQPKQGVVTPDLYPLGDSSSDLIYYPTSHDRTGLQLPTDESPILLRGQGQYIGSHYMPDAAGGGITVGSAMRTVQTFDFGQSPPSTDGPSSPGSFFPPSSPSASSMMIDDPSLGCSSGFNGFNQPGSGPQASSTMLEKPLLAVTGQPSSMGYYPGDPGFYNEPQVRPVKNMYNPSPFDASRSFGSCNLATDIPTPPYHVKDETDQSSEVGVPKQSPRNGTKKSPKDREAYIPCPLKFAGCDKMFKAKNEWKRHFERLHIESKYWVCSHKTCSHKGPKDRFFNRGDLFQNHYIRMHLCVEGGSIEKCNTEQKAKAKIATFRARRERQLNVPQFVECPANGCSELFPGNKIQDRMMEHLYKHHKDAQQYGREMTLVGGSCSQTFTNWAADNEIIVPQSPTGWKCIRALERTLPEAVLLSDVDAEGELDWEV